MRDIKEKSQKQQKENSALCFIMICLYLVVPAFIALHGLSLVARSRATLRCGQWASYCGGISCCGAHALGV